MSTPGGPPRDAPVRDAPHAHLRDEEVDAVADGAPGAADGAAGRHLAACARCRREVADARAILAAARDARTGVPAPPELWPLVAAATIYEAPVRRRVLRRLRPRLALAAVALALGGAAATALVLARPDARASPANGAAPRPPIPPRAPAPPAPPAGAP